MFCYQLLQPPTVQMAEGWEGGGEKVEGGREGGRVRKDGVNERVEQGGEAEEKKEDLWLYS